MSNPVGRPSELEGSIEPAWEYVNGGYAANEEVIPSVAGLAVHINKARRTIYAWAKENEQFYNILEKLMAKQERALTNGGLAGDLNSTITKLMLTKHGYSDKQDTTLTGAEGGPLQIQEVKRVIVDSIED